MHIFFGEDKSQHNAAVNYMFLVIAFALGAIVSALLQKIFVLKTIENFENNETQSFFIYLKNI